MRPLLPDWVRNLPVNGVLDELAQSLVSHKSAVLVAPPGAGKTLRVPLALLESGLLSDKQLIMLEPRRMATVASARTMASLVGEKVGETVGYQVRFENCTSAQTRIAVITEGILSRRLISDPFLEDVACVVIDEFHERSIHSDLALAFLKELSDVRDDLSILVMSATINPQPISHYLSHCPIIESRGKLYDVQIEYLPRNDDRPLPVLCSAAVQRLLGAENDDGKDILVFLPGEAEIKRTLEVLQQKTPREIEIVPLYGALGIEAQEKVLSPSTKRRIILSTNIAETSLTIPGVTSVVDSGLMRLLRLHPQDGIDHLQTVPISHQNADQRAGRAGRIAPGRVVRLWTQAAHHSRPHSITPEIRRIDLCSPLLSVIGFAGRNPVDFAFFEAPSKHLIEMSLNTLDLLGALEEGRSRLSERGVELLGLPVHPRVGTLLLEAKNRDRPNLGARLGALLFGRDIVERHTLDALAEQGETHDSDLVFRLELLEEFIATGGSRLSANRLGLDYVASTSALHAELQLLRHVGRLGTKNTRFAIDEHDVATLVLCAFPDRICVRKKLVRDEALMIGGRTALLGRHSFVRQAPIFVAAHIQATESGQSRKNHVQLANAITIEQVQEVIPRLVKKERTQRFDPQKQIVLSVDQLRLGDLVVEESIADGADTIESARVLALEAQKHFATVFKPAEDALALIQRLRFAKRALPEEDWPDTSDAALKNHLEALSQGKRSFDDLKRIDWKVFLSNQLSYTLKQILDTHVPTHIEVPSKRSLKIDYANAAAKDGQPILAARIQELFGWSQIPTIAKGRVPLLIHLLAPNGRPIQITQDLSSFWNETYEQVRKDLAGRYPKHHWPKNPWDAVATSRVKPRKK